MRLEKVVIKSRIKFRVILIKMIYYFKFNMGDKIYVKLLHADFIKNYLNHICIQLFINCYKKHKYYIGLYFNK